LKNRILLGILLATILLVSLLAANVKGNQPIENAALADNQVPIVDSPVDIVYVEGTTGHSITWEISDDDPSYWLIFKDGVHIDDGAWVEYNETVIVDVDGLSTGSYEYVMLASDSYINVTDIVLVIVLSTDIEVHAPFSISSNTDFNDTAQAEGWIGNGSLANPFIIEKLFIEASSDCFKLQGTTAHFIIKNCTFVKSDTESGIGINLQSVENGVIEYCTFTNLWMGCITWFTSNCTWNENSFGNLMDGLWIQESLDCVITDNTFQSGGISFAGYNILNWIHEVSGNTIREKRLGYFEGLFVQDIDVTNYGQVILVNCLDVTVRNGDFSDVGVPISIGHSNYSRALNCKSSGGRTGIFVERTRDVNIESCLIVGTAEVGMILNETVETNVINCTILNAGWIGIQVAKGQIVNIQNSLVKGCIDSGIACFESPGFWLRNCTLQDDTYGLQIGGSSHSRIFENKFLFNDQYGIFIMWGCNDSRIYDNEFVFNSIGNAYDDGLETFWDNGLSIGNIWDDYSGTGFYYVPGTRGGIDHYPRFIDIPSEIDILGNLTEDITYTLGTTGHDIVWYTNCTHPQKYLIHKDGVLVKEQEWDGSEWPITYNVDGLPVGEHEYLLVILDQFEHQAFDFVVVTVNPQTVITIDTGPIISNSTTTTNNGTTNGTTSGGIQEFTLVISIGSTIVIVVVIILILRSKKSSM